MDLLSALQWEAIRDVHRHNQGKELARSEYALERVFRWYSKTFSTPLHLVDELPLEDVVRAHWQEHYESLTPEELEDELETLRKDPEVLKRQQKEEDAADADTWEIAKEEEEAQAKLAKDALKKKSSTPITAVRRSKPGAEAQLITNPTVEKPPSISMKFLPDDEELDLEKDGFGLLEKPR